jgi:cyanate lyase
MDKQERANLRKELEREGKELGATREEIDNAERQAESFIEAGGMTEAQVEAEARRETDKILDLRRENVGEDPATYQGGSSFGDSAAEWNQDGEADGSK